MALKKKRKIVCRYCGYHMDAGKKRCPFCGSYVDPEEVTAEYYSLHNIRERLSGREKDIPGAIYITEKDYGSHRKILKRVILIVILCCVIAGGAVGGRKLYQIVMDRISSVTDSSEPVIGTLTVMNQAGIPARSTPSFSAESAGTAKAGKSYSVYETAEAEGYSWYRIDQNTWIADDGTGVTYSPEGGTSDE